MRQVENRKIPDSLVRLGIRSLLAERLRAEASAGKDVSIDDMVAELKRSPIAIDTEKANEQHYELPPEYFRIVLGPRLKYSSGYWPSASTDLSASEDAMLDMSCHRAELQDGQAILELGCGWGSLTLWMAEKYPNANITAVSNSRFQREFILGRAAELGFGNVTVITADMNTFKPDATFDRIVSVEMFEHMKNYDHLLRRIKKWLKPQGRLFVHIFTHTKFTYHFETSSNPDDWMANYFFTGGTMPGDDLLLRFQDDLRIERHWRINGRHYSRTLEAWLKKQDAHEAAILPLFIETYGNENEAKLWIQRWRLFYLACSELFRYNDGREWMVSHYLFRNPD